MLLSEESNGTFRLQNNAVYNFLSIQYSIKFNHKLGRKMKHEPTVSLQKYKWNTKQVLAKLSWNISENISQGSWKMKESQNLQATFSMHIQELCVHST